MQYIGFKCILILSINIFNKLLAYRIIINYIYYILFQPRGRWTVLRNDEYAILFGVIHSCGQGPLLLIWINLSMDK